MKIAEEPKDTIAQWVADRLPDLDGFEPPYKTIAVIRNDRIAAAAVFNNWTEAGPEISFAADTPRWATKEAVKLILGYPFMADPNCRRITAIAHKKNRRARKLNEGIGFKLEGTIRKAFPNGDGCIYGLTREDFEKGKFNG